ncbi:MAG: hypothetical protein Q8P01_05605 [bacterium]|nr:hypothetical protein [bacterium]
MATRHARQVERADGTVVYQYDVFGGPGVWDLLLSLGVRNDSDNSLRTVVFQTVRWFRADLWSIGHVLGRADHVCVQIQELDRVASEGVFAFRGVCVNVGQARGPKIHENRLVCGQIDAHRRIGWIELPWEPMEELPLPQEWSA